MRFLILLLLLLLTKISHSQYFDWAINLKNQISVNHNLFINDVAIDDSNFIYIALYIEGLVKFDSDSNLVWQNTYPDFNASHVKYKNNKIYLAGDYFTDHSRIYCPVKILAMGDFCKQQEKQE